MEEVKEKEQIHELIEDKTTVSPISEESGLIIGLRSCCILPQRFVLGIMSLLGICNAYTMRVCLNLAIIQMVNQTKTIDSHYDPDACPVDHVVGDSEANKTIIEIPHAIFHWPEETQGMILSAFYYGYATTQVLGGYLSERFGAKWVLGIGLLSTAIFTFFTPIVTKWGGAPSLFLLRVLQGMGEGPSVPALMTIMARWIPPHERSFQGALIFGGAHIGNVFGSSMSGILLSNGRDWAYVFYFFGGFGLLWFVLWSLLSYSTPDSHPYIATKELNYLKSKVKTAEYKSAKDPAPWKAIIRSKPVWAIVAAAIGHDWGYYTMITDLAKYSHDVLKFNIAATGSLIALPYISLWLSSFLFGFIGDLSIKRGWHSLKTGRIIHTTIGIMIFGIVSIHRTRQQQHVRIHAICIVATTGPAICIILASYSGCNRNLAMVYFILSMTTMGGFYSGMKVNTLDLAPNYAGSVTSLANTISTLTGIISPYLVGLLTPDSTLIQWRVVFWVCFAVMVGTNLVYCMWADGKQQWWDDIRQYGYPPDWKHGPLIPNEVKLAPTKLCEDLKDNVTVNI